MWGFTYTNSDRGAKMTCGSIVRLLSYRYSPLHTRAAGGEHKCLLLPVPACLRVLAGACLHKTHPYTLMYTHTFNHQLDMNNTYSNQIIHTLNMYVCVYVNFLFLCISRAHAHTHTHTYPYTEHKYSRTHTRTHTHTYIHTHTNTHIHKHTRTHTHIHTRTHTHTCTHINKPKHTYTKKKSTQTHTHVHTHTPTRKTNT